MSADTQGRLSYLTHTLDLLWPDAAPDRPMVVLPSDAAPRLLVPTRPRRAGAASVLRYTAQQSRRDRAAGAVLAAAVVAGYAKTRRPVRSTRAGCGAESIDDHLGRVLGGAVVSSLALTRDRPNRKPVLQVFDHAGRTVAFAKVGVSELAATLVRAEGDAMRRLEGAGLRTAVVPRVLSQQEWNGHPVLVASALRSGVAVSADLGPLGTAMREVSHAGDGTPAGYLDALRARLAGARSATAHAADTGADTAADRARADALELWADTFERLVEAHPVDGLSVGGWHGDWTPWNCARRSGRVLVWDWERFTEPAPHGFDMLHFVLNRDFGAGDHNRGRTVAATLIEQAGQLLRPWRLTDADAQIVALLYLLDIALRYLQDDARSTDARGRVEDWALPAVRSRLGLIT